MVRFTKLNALSAWTHSDGHLQQKTLHGALITALGVLLAITLFLSEFRACTHKTVTQKLTVDQSRADFINLNVNMTFPALPCQAINVDLRDISGERLTDSSLARGGGVHKVRTNRYGQTLGVDYVYPGHNLDFAILARDRQLVDDLERALETHEGCTLYGLMQVRRVAGSLVVSIHLEDFFGLPENVAQLKAALEKRQSHLEPEVHPDTGLDLELDTTRINVSHVINDVTFGPAFPGMQRPLTGVQRITDESGGVYRYYLKIVPTVYRPLHGRSTFTNQYSVTEYYAQQRLGSGRLPGVYLLYDLSPVQMELKESRVGWGHLLVRMCAVIGGVFAVTGLIDGWVHRLITSFFDTDGGKGKGKGPGSGHLKYHGTSAGQPPANGIGAGAGPTSVGYGGGGVGGYGSGGGYNSSSYGAAATAYGGAPAAGGVDYGAQYGVPAAAVPQYNGDHGGSYSNGTGSGVGIGSAYNAYGGATSYAVPRGAAAAQQHQHGGSSAGGGVPPGSAYGADKRAY